MKLLKIMLSLMLMIILFQPIVNSQTLLNPVDPASLCADVKPSNLTYGDIMGINFRNYHEVPVGVDMDDISSFIRYFHLMNELPPNGDSGRDFGESNPANYSPTVCPNPIDFPITSSINCYDCSGNDSLMHSMRSRYCLAKQNGVSTIHAAIEKLQFGGDFFNKMFTSAEWGSDLADRFNNGRDYGKKFAENYCPTDPNKACLVDILEIGNEPWGEPGLTNYRAVYRGLLQGINDYYTSTSPTINYTSSTTLDPNQMNVSAWRMKTSSGSYQFFQETTYWGTNDNVGTIPNDIWPYLEAVNVHPYAFKFNRNSNDEMSQITLELDQHPESRNSLYLTILNAIKWRNENQSTKQLISTEYGWDSQKVGFEAQAVYLVRAMLMAGRFKLNEAVLYEIYDTADDNSTGLYTTSGLIKLDGTTKKQSFYAVKRFKNLLGDKIFLDKLNGNDFQDVNSNNDYFAYLVGGTDRKPTHLVVWLPENINNGTNLGSQNITINNFPSNFSINTNSISTKLNGASGNDETVSTGSIVTVNGSSVTVNASPIPYFIPLNSTSFTYAANSGNPTITNCSGGPCAGQGGDADGDGICANVDCNDNDPLAGVSQPQYTPCNDGNPNTSFDMIQADECTCLGTDCGSGGATQFSGCNVTVEVDGQNVRFVSTTETGNLILKVRRANWSEQYDLCNDYNNNTECSTSSVATVTGTGAYVIDVQGGTGCGTFNITVGGGGGGGTDADNDSVCDLIDCDDNDASVGEPQPEDTPCDDGDSNTTNDMIQEDGCTCEGTNNGCQTDVDNDGVCANEDCNDNDASVGAIQPQYTPCNDGNPNTSFDMIQADGCTCLGTDCGSGATQFSGCNVTVEVDGQDVRFVSTTETGTLILKVRRANWSEQYDLCNDYNNNTECSTSSVATVTGTGAYVIDVQGGTGCSSFNITVGGGGGGGTDADNDSVCDLIDCDDNDASVGEPQPAGTSCDDGDSNTTNDVILSDGCMCEGTNNGCQTDIDGDGVCANEDCNDNDASVGAIQPQYTPCNDGNSNTSFDMIQADGCTCLGTDCSSGATQFSGCNVAVEVDGQDVKFVSTTETGTLIIKVRRANWSEQYDLCNDYNNNTECSTSSVATVTGTGTYVVDIQGGTGCSSFNITVGGGGGATDADNDSVCDLIDCDDNDASVGEPQPAGTSCDDGNSGTTNDVILADGCTCQGSTNLVANTTNSASTINPELAIHPDGGKTIDTHIDEIKIYPNPADNILYVEMKKYANKRGKVEVFNQLGQRKISNIYVSIPSDAVNIDLSQFESGVYIMVIQVGENHREIKQFVVIDK